MDIKIIYYDIDERAAKHAHDMNSFRTYMDGQTTAEYRGLADKAAEIADRQQSKVDPMYHDKIDGLLNAYSRKLADWFNKSSAIEARCPSMMISGGGNFPVRKKERQNAARDRHVQAYNDITELLRKIEAVGMGGISSDDPDALGKLKAKLEHLENGGGKGRMASNVSAEKRRLKGRIAELERRAEKPPQGWKFDGGEVVANAEANRLQIIFDGKPDDELRATLKHSGFRWAPSVKAWQRQLTNNAIWAARQIAALKGGLI